MNTYFDINGPYELVNRALFFLLHTEVETPPRSIGVLRKRRDELLQRFMKTQDKQPTAISIAFASKFEACPLADTEFTLLQCDTCTRNLLAETEDCHSKPPKSRSGFVTALDEVRKRSKIGDQTAVKLLTTISTSKGGIESYEPLVPPSSCSAEKSGENEHLTAGRNDTVQALTKCLGGEVKEDIVALILSMMLSPANFVCEEDIAGLVSVKKLIRDKIISPIRRPDLHQGLHQAPRGILLFGPPGTGKTMLAKWVASESGASFFEVTPSALISKFYGETETIIKSLFKIAERLSPSIVFIDEIDSLLGQRGHRDDDNTVRMKNQFLQMMDGIGSNLSSMVVVIGATNRPEMLDDAAIRRLTRRVLVPLPDTDARAGQIRRLLEKHYSVEAKQDHSNTTGTAASDGQVHGSTVLSESEIFALAEQLEGWNGADIKALCTRAADYPYDDAIAKYGNLDQIPDITAFRQITYQDFCQALQDVRPSVSLVRQPSLVEWESLFGCK